MVFLAKQFCKEAEEEMGEHLRAGIDGGSQLLSLQWCSGGGVLHPVIIQAVY